MNFCAINTVTRTLLLDNSFLPQLRRIGDVTTVGRASAISVDLSSPRTIGGLKVLIH
jgi:hypothetical protein